jgi:hypothetical protein
MDRFHALLAVKELENWWFPSFEDVEGVTMEVLLIARAIRQYLQRLGEDKCPKIDVLENDYFTAQTALYRIKKLINPRGWPAEDERRAAAFCVGWASKAAFAAFKFLQTFDEFPKHFDEFPTRYGWHSLATRAAFDEDTRSGSGESCEYGENKDAFEEVLAFAEGLLTALERAAKKLWLSVVEEMGLSLDAQARRTLATTVFGLTTEMLACLIRSKNPGWTDQQVADAVPCNRQHMLRFKAYRALVQQIKAEGKARRLPGRRKSREDAAGRKHSELEAITDDTGLQDFIENEVHKPFKEEEE